MDSKDDNNYKNINFCTWLFKAGRDNVKLIALAAAPVAVYTLNAWLEPRIRNVGL